MSNLVSEFSFYRQVELDVERQGFHLVSVKNRNGELLYVYSIGMYCHQQPEIIFMDCSLDQAFTLLHALSKNKRKECPTLSPAMLLRIGSSVYSTTPAEPHIIQSLMKHANDFYQIKRPGQPLSAITVVSQCE